MDVQGMGDGELEVLAAEVQKLAHRVPMYTSTRKMVQHGKVKCGSGQNKTNVDLGGRLTFSSQLLQDRLSEVKKRSKCHACDKGRPVGQRPRVHREEMWGKGKSKGRGKGARPLVFLARAGLASCSSRRPSTQSPPSLSATPPASTACHPAKRSSTPAPSQDAPAARLSALASSSSAS